MLLMISGALSTQSGSSWTSVLRITVLLLCSLFFSSSSNASHSSLSSLQFGPFFSRGRFASLFFALSGLGPRPSGRLFRVTGARYLSPPLELGVVIYRRCYAFPSLWFGPQAIGFCCSRLIPCLQCRFDHCRRWRSCCWKVRAVPSWTILYLEGLSRWWSKYAVERNCCETVSPPLAAIRGNALYPYEPN